MRHVDDSLKQHYLDQRLGDERVERILAAARSAGGTVRDPAEDPEGRPAGSGSGNRGPRRAILAWAAAAVLAVVLGAALLLPSTDDGLTAKVVGEVAYNHLKGYDVDIRSDRYEIVQAGLDRLDFSILPTRGRLLRDFDLVGGRYCSIQEVLAAQLSVRRRDNGSVCTLYVAPVTETLRPVGDGIGTFGEVQVELWRDDGRLFALAGGC
ncbi:MAG: hypothetical protein AAGD06_10255 [Acidobacteriota bacterium]